MQTYQQPHYQNFKDCTYWPVLGYFNNWNIIQLSHKGKYCGDIDKMHQVALDGISDNMAALVQTGQYDDINTTDTTTMTYYVIKFLSESYTLQEDTMCDGKISNSG